MKHLLYADMASAAASIPTSYFIFQIDYEVADYILSLSAFHKRLPLNDRESIP